MKAPGTVRIESQKKIHELVARTEGILRGQRGQSLYELALILPLLLLLLVGVIDLGWFAYLDICVGNAARAGAAYASQGTSQADPNISSDVATAVNNDFGTENGALTTTLSNACGCDTGGGSYLGIVQHFRHAHYLHRIRYQ